VFRFTSQEKFCFLLSIVATLALGAESSAQWRVTDFPHPVYQSKQCGRKEASWICDPNGIISTEDGKSNVIISTEGGKSNGIISMEDRKPSGIRSLPAQRS
jgi:hypothetical protein